MIYFVIWLIAVFIIWIFFIKHVENKKGSEFMKTWSELTPKEKMEITCRDLERKKKLQEIGKREADTFIFENIHKCKKERNKIRSRVYRGK